MLRERIENSRRGISPAGMSRELDSSAQEYQQLKTRVHQQLLDRVDLAAVENMQPAQLRAELKLLVERLLEEANAPINEFERSRLVADIQNEVLGLGPLEELMADPSVSDILVNTYRQVYVERKGKLVLTSVRFADDDHLLKIIDKIVSRVGRRIDESSPMVDARLPDGSRVNAIIPPLAIDGPILSIRRFAVVPLKMEDLLQYQTLSSEMAEFLAGLVHAKVNLLISGGTGAGKTTLLNILSSFIPETERIVTIEDAAELQLQQAHVIRLETRPPNIEGKGEITQRALVRNSLRMRPDRIVVGEVRGSEVLDMLQAMNTGHEGSMATVHANTARDALTRLENMLSMAGMNAPPKGLRQQISSAISVIVQVLRLRDGRRKVMSIQEITGVEGDVISMQEIFQFQQSGVDQEGRVLGEFRASGIRPKVVDRMRANGIRITETMFDPGRRLEVRYE